MANPFRGKANSSKFSTEIPEVGPHAAVLVALIDKGTHTEEVKEEKTGKMVPKDLRKLMLVWELTDAPMSGTQHNHVVFKEYNLSFHNSGHLRKLAEAIRGAPWVDEQDINYDAMVGAKCLVSILHKTAKGSGREYAVVQSVSKPMKGQAVPPAKRQPFSWYLDDDNLAATDYSKIPDWIPFRKDLIEEIKYSHQIRGKHGNGGDRPAPAGGIDHYDDAVPAPSGAGMPAGADDGDTIPF
ncbi:MAG: hypothetical protein U0840_25570 [Gemmataceae bacterium]